jgi:hypothetical protein
MKKSALAVAVAATVTSQAYAQMYVNPDKTGQYLIYPFYTADTGNETYISVVNTTAQAKAVKVRIVEAENSWEVRDFNVYMSPYDHFSFSISLDESGAGRLDTADNSCTVPSLANGVAFTNALFADEENGTLERTINGHVEIIEMGQFGRLTEAGWVETEDDTIPALWLHAEQADGSWAPNDCEAVVDLWTAGTNGAASGDWYAEGPPGQNRNGWSGQGTVWRGGGLYGTGMVVNPDQGWGMGYDAVAVENFVVAGTAGNTANNVGGGAHLHFYPGDTDPGLGTSRDGISDDATIFASYNGTAPGTYTITTPAPALTMATLFQAEKIQNEFVLEPFFDGSTDWVVSFPTKHHHVNTGTDPIVPFTNIWDGNESCDTYSIQTWDREEKTFEPEGGQITPPFSPYTAPEVEEQVVELCYETNILTFGTQDADTGEGEFDSVFWGLEPSASSSRVHTPIGTAYTSGWAELTWTDTDHAIPLANGDALLGLPAVGFAAVQFENGTINNGATLANYAGTHEHKMQKTLSTSAN